MTYTEVKHDNILQSLNADQHNTRSTNDTVSFNSSEVRNYNTNSEFFNRHNSRQSDYRQSSRQFQDRWSRKELSFDQSKNRPNSYPSTERKRDYITQNSRDYTRSRDSSSNNRYNRRRSSQSNDYYIN